MRKTVLGLLLAVTMCIAIPVCAQQSQWRGQQTQAASVQPGPQFDWNDAARERYTGSRASALAQSGWPAHVQTKFLEMFGVDAANERARLREGTYYRLELIPSEFRFQWMMFGANTKRTNVVAHTLQWRQHLSREAAVYRVEDPVTMMEYTFFSPIECNNASGNVRKILICICPDKTKPCPK